MNYAYKDTGRTKIIYADSSDIIKYKGVRCYCKNPSCNAKMFIHNPEHPNFAYFQASGNHLIMEVAGLFIIILIIANMMKNYLVFQKC